jgi:DNA-binding phage protein
LASPKIAQSIGRKKSMTKLRKKEKINREKIRKRAKKK